MAGAWLGGGRGLTGGWPPAPGRPQDVAANLKPACSGTARCARMGSWGTQARATATQSNIPAAHACGKRPLDSVGLILQWTCITRKGAGGGLFFVFSLPKFECPWPPTSATNRAATVPGPPRKNSESGSGLNKLDCRPRWPPEALQGLKHWQGVGNSTHTKCMMVGKPNRDVFACDRELVSMLKGYDGTISPSLLH